MVLTVFAALILCACSPGANNPATTDEPASTEAYENAEDGFVAYTVRVEYQQGSNAVYIAQSEGDILNIPLPLNLLSEDPTDGMSKYTEEFFKDRALLVLDTTVNTGSTKLTVSDVYVENGILCARVLADTPDIGTADMAQYRIYVEFEHDNAIEIIGSDISMGEQ